MKLTFIIICSLLLWSCTDTEEKKKETEAKNSTTNANTEEPINPDDLIEVKNNIYTEYYDLEKTKIKFQGEQDAEKKRHGKWVHYHRNGLEAGITFYTNGIRNGYSSVKRPNGAMYYHGEYKNDKPTGVWKYYDEKGEFSYEQDYGDSE